MTTNNSINYKLTILNVICLLIFIANNCFALTCKEVRHVGAGDLRYYELSKYILKYINNNQTDHVQIIKIRTIDNIDNWYVAEVEFDKLEPSIFVIRSNEKTFKVLSEFAGSTSPADPDEIIWKYFIKHVPEAPEILIKCFKAKGEPFLIKK